MPAPPGFELHEEIGRGGMGAVYRALDHALGREVAVKVLREGGASARRFVTEARITGQLQHPGVPPVYQVGELPDGRPFLAMKLVKGETLTELLKSGADRERLVAAFEGVCQTVAYAHAKGVIHRDLKPANVMVGAFGEVQVMDWGLAKAMVSREAESSEPSADPTPPPDATQAGEVFGTPHYMAPEQAAGLAAAVDRRSDVFGLGAVLCELLTGKPPYRAADPDSTRRLAAQADLTDAHARLSGCGADPGLVELCKRCLSADRVDRPADAGEVAAAVAALRLAAADRARRAELAVAAGRVRRRLVVVLAGVLVAAALTAGVLWRRAAAALAEAEVDKGHTLVALRALTGQAVDDAFGRRAEPTPADRAFLQSVRSLWEGVAATRGRRADALALRAEGNVRVAAVCRRLGEAEAAETAFRAGLAAYAELVALAPADPDRRLELAQAHTAFGWLLLAAGRLPAAEAEFRAALVHGDRPADARVLGEAAQGLAETLDAAGRTADAEAAYRRALDLRGRRAADHPADPFAQPELFETVYCLSRLLRKAGRAADGRAVLDTALAGGPPAAPGGGTPAERHAQAVTLSGLAEALRDTGRGAESADAYRRALAAHRGLMIEFPARTYHRQDVGKAANGLANLLAGLGRPAEAEAAFRETLAMRVRLAAEGPADPARRRELADTHTNLANLLRDANRVSEAETAFREALAVRERLAADFPDQPAFRTDVGGVLVNLGDLLRTADRPAEAVGLYARAVGLVEPSHAAEPTRLDPRVFLLDAHWGRALALDRLGKPREALADWDRAVALSGDGSRPACRAGRAVSRLKAGQTADAHAEAAAAGPLSGYGWYTLARFAAVAGDADAAMVRLRRAEAAGWRRAAVLRTDPDFTGLRGRLDFKWLLARMQTRAERR